MSSVSVIIFFRLQFWSSFYYLSSRRQRRLRNFRTFLHNRNNEGKNVIIYCPFLLHARWLFKNPSHNRAMEKHGEMLKVKSKRNSFAWMNFSFVLLFVFFCQWFWNLFKFSLHFDMWLRLVCPLFKCITMLQPIVEQIRIALSSR